MTEAIRVAAIGECMLELSDPSHGTPVLSYGGDTLNTAIYLARLLEGRGVQVDYLTALGDDPYSAAMLEGWQAEGLGTDLVARLRGRLPGLYAIRTDAAGERSFYYWRSAAAARSMLQGRHGRRLCAALPGYALIYLSGITLSILAPAARVRLLQALDAARAAGAQVAFDINYRPRGWRAPATARAVVDAALQRADLALPGLEDAVALYGTDTAEACAEDIAARGVAEICVKDGAGDCLLLDAAGRRRCPPPRRIEPLDTTAAGDSFNAGYLAARLLGLGADAAAGAGHRLAAEVIRHRGAVIARAAMPQLGLPAGPPAAQAAGQPP